MFDQKVDEIVFMTRDLPEKEEESSQPEFPEGIKTILVKDTSENDLYSCFHESFSKSGDRNVLSLSDEEKKDLKITLLADEDKELCNTFGVWQLKKFMGKEYMGVVRSTFIINPEGKVAATWTKVRVKNHVADVKAKLEELQA